VRDIVARNYSLRRQVGNDAIPFWVIAR
jgi:hypothetical protein